MPSIHPSLRKNDVRCALSISVAALLANLVGCSRSVDSHVVPLTKSEDNLKFIALAYLDAHSELGRGPKNADELKQFLQPFGNPDELLISPNDNEPYVVIWGADPSRGGPGDYEGMFPILAYERKGLRGMRAVTDIRGRPLTIPEADLLKLSFAGRHRPAVN